MVAGQLARLADTSTRNPMQSRKKGKSNTLKNFLDALLAVLAGNAIYYLLMPYLPMAARHRLFQEDWGLLVDFGICTAIFVAVKYARRNEDAV
jgi:hypothetical protein